MKVDKNRIPIKFKILRYLNNIEGMKVGKAARYLDVTDSRFNVIINKLAVEGFVSFTHSDNRSKEIVLTEKGRATSNLFCEVDQLIQLFDTLKVNGFKK